MVVKPIRYAETQTLLFIDLFKIYKPEWIELLTVYRRLWRLFKPDVFPRT